MVIESVVTLGFGVKTIVLSFSWKCLSVFFQQLSDSQTSDLFTVFFRKGCVIVMRLYQFGFDVEHNLRMHTCVLDCLFRKGFFLSFEHFIIY